MTTKHRQLTEQEEEQARRLFAQNGLDHFACTLDQCRAVVVESNDERAFYLASGGNPSFMAEIIHAAEKGELTDDEALLKVDEHNKARRDAWERRKTGESA